MSIIGMGNVLDWMSVNWVEISAAIVSLAYVILTIKQIIWLWFFGILSAILYAWVYAHSGFYAGMTLQGYYAVISIYGWFHWSSKAKNPDAKDAGFPIVRAGSRLMLLVIAVWLVLWLFIGYLLLQYTNSKIPFWDAFTASGGIVATWMLTRKILEQWIFWIFIDMVSIGLYIWQGLYATTLLFLVYVVMAVLGYRQWRKSCLTVK
jgi:nicotinamide mononucleotide transporter